MQRIMLSCLVLAVMTITGCSKDNHDSPQSTLAGRVVYNGHPLSLRSNGVQLELWQDGFDLRTKIPIYVTQEGAFSATLFDGNYKLVQLNGNGPWVSSTDTIDITVSGHTEVDVPVTPYFIITSSTITQNGTNINASVRLTQVNNSLPLDAVSLYLGSTTIVDQVNSVAGASVAAADITDITQPVSLTAAIPTSLTAKGYLYARVGVKTAGVAELLYTVPVKVELK
ncbi:DUF3823 domain-containing protein [Chitinophaga japonensis]|nr:DUF3823 domain-containing protein [Chitinophaga japonensis]